MSNTQKIITVPVWNEGGLFEYTGKITYGMIYDEVIHNSCFQMKAYEGSRKKGQRLHVDWEYTARNTHDFVTDKAPHLLELLQFDGWAATGLPVDYHANALYFYKRFRGWYTIAGKSIQSGKHPHWLLFCDLTLLGDEALPTIDSEKELYVLSQWLKKREPKLRAKFNDAMRKHEIE